MRQNGASLPDGGWDLYRKHYISATFHAKTSADKANAEPAPILKNASDMETDVGVTSSRHTAKSVGTIRTRDAALLRKWEPVLITKNITKKATPLKGQPSIHIPKNCGLFSQLVV